MAKASGGTQKSKCPPQSVSASGDTINEYIKNVSKKQDSINISTNPNGI